MSIWTIISFHGCRKLEVIVLLLIYVHYTLSAAPSVVGFQLLLVLSNCTTTNSTTCCQQSSAGHSDGCLSTDRCAGFTTCVMFLASCLLDPRLLAFCLSDSCLSDSCLLASRLSDSCLLDSCLLTSRLSDSCLLRVAGLWVVGRWVAGLWVAGL